MTEIKRCPICGGKATWWLTWYPECEPGATGTMYAVRCMKCGAEGRSRGTKEDSIMSWNSMSREELEKLLDERVATGEMTEEEAEMEWQDYMHRDETWSEW